MINQVRGLVQGFGARLRACSAECFHKEPLPEALAATLTPVMDAIAHHTAQIRAYDREVATQVAAQPTVQRLTQVTGGGDPRLAPASAFPRWSRPRRIFPCTGVQADSNESANGRLTSARA